MAKTPLGGLGLIPDQGTRSHMPQVTPSTAKLKKKKKKKVKVVNFC